MKGTKRALLFLMVAIDGQVASVYEDVRNDKTPTNWLLLGYTDDKETALKVIHSGIEKVTQVRVD
jgi:hypothetical protein